MRVEEIQAVWNVVHAAAKVVADDEERKATSATNRHLHDRTGLFVHGHEHGDGCGVNLEKLKAALDALDECSKGIDLIGEKNDHIRQLQAKCVEKDQEIQRCKTRVADSQTLYRALQEKLTRFATIRDLLQTIDDLSVNDDIQICGRHIEGNPQNICHVEVDEAGNHKGDCSLSLIRQ